MIVQQVSATSLIVDPADVERELNSAVGYRGHCLSKGTSCIDKVWISLLPACYENDRCKERLETFGVDKGFRTGGDLSRGVIVEKGMCAMERGALE